MREGLKMTLVLSSIIFLSQICWIQGEEIFLAHYSSKYGKLCKDKCSKRGGDYYYCNTDKGSDYCSLAENTDYKGTACRVDHPCEKHGRDYYWCRNNAGGSENCGKVSFVKMQHVSSTYRSMCKSDCLYDYEESHYWCNTQYGWDYCSPKFDVTYQNEPCQSGHPCGSYGEYYTWCYTDSSWDYCGLIEARILTYFNNRRTKRKVESSSNDGVEICNNYSKDNKKLITLYALNVDTIINGKQWKKDIAEAILCWKNSYLRDQVKSNLVPTVPKTLRIDLQGMLKRENQQYYNLQIQLNVNRRAGVSTTVAQVLLPKNEDVPDIIVRRAFTESFQRLAKVTVVVRHGTFPVKQNNKDNCE